MEENNQEGYQELGWIINKSEEGIFLVIASAVPKRDRLHMF